MSSHHARIGKNQRWNSRRQVEAIGVTSVLIAILAIPFYEHFVNKHYARDWPSVTGHVLETRIVTLGSEDRAYRPGEILYRVEAHVVYKVNGEQFDRWLPASDINSEKTYLQFWLSQKKNKLCIVHWNPDNPSDIEALLT